MLPRNC